MTENMEYCPLIYKYLLINELKLQGIALRAHVNDCVAHTPGLILHQD